MDAYKRSEGDPATGLAIFALNSTLTDLAEPGESLLATTVAQIGLTRADYLLSSAQLDAFRSGEEIAAETETYGRRGAYFVHATLDLALAKKPPGIWWQMSSRIVQPSSKRSAGCKAIGRPLPGNWKPISQPTS